METKNTINTKDIFQYCIAVLIIIGEIIMLGFLLSLWKKGVSTTDQNVVNLIFGIAMAYHSGFMMVLGYFFLSNKDSARKTEMIHNSTPIVE